MKKIRKEWMGFFFCLALTGLLTLAILWNARTEFHRQVIQSEVYLIKAEIKRISEELELTFMERDLTFLDLGIPDLVHNQRDLIEQLALETISITRVSQLFAYDGEGIPIELPTDTTQSIADQSMIKQAKKVGMAHAHKSGQPFALLFDMEVMEGPYFLEIHMDETPILREWNAIDAQLLQQGALIILCGAVLLFVIFRSLSLRFSNGNGSLWQKGNSFKKPTANWLKATKAPA